MTLRSLLNHYKPILTTLLIGLVIFGIGTDVWAAGACMGNDAIERAGESSYLITALINIMAWAWSIPAVLAGELMSNDLVYGQLVGLEHYFYQFWTLMRTIANIALVAIIVTVIAQIMFKGAKAKEILSKYGVRLLMSGILINMSRFLMGALVDISTIAIAGVGQIGSAFMTQTMNGGKSSSSMNVGRMDSIMMSIPDKVVVDECGCLTATSEKSAKTNKTREQIISKRNTITGPLVFLGAGVMKLSAYTMDVGCKSTSIGDVGKLTLKMILQLFLMMMFVVPLLVLVAFNFFRLIYLWGWIVCSPLIVLINLFDEAGKMVGDDIKKAVSLDTMIRGLFQPVFTVGALVIGMMLVMGMYHAMDYQQTETLDNMDGIINKAGSSQIAMGTNGDLGSITLVDKIIEDPTGTIGGGFGYLLVSLATCFVLWMLVKLSFTMSKGGVGAAMGFDAEKLMGTMRGEFMKRITLPQRGGPLGGASLKEAASFIDPTDKDNRIMKKIGSIGDGMTKSGIARANEGLEKSWAGELLGMQDNADLRDEDGVKVKEAKITDSDYASALSAPIEGLKQSAKSQESKKSMKIDRAGRKSYQIMEEWYNKIGKSAIESMGIETPAKDKDSKPEKLKLGSFEEEYKKSSSYVGGLIEYLAKGEKVSIKDSKLDFKVKEKRISDIDFKNL